MAVTHMTPAGASVIEEPWPESDTEVVERCPYCGTADRAVAHRDVQDWSFYCAPGKWTYWSCGHCESLFLSPRPNRASIGRAYGSYYTHGTAAARPVVGRIQDRVRNEAWSHWLGADISPRLHLPAPVSWMLRFLKSRLAPRFEVSELAALPPGKVVDVGCGHGYMLGVAQGLGWSAVGLEIDPLAVRAARARMLDVREGSYSRIQEFQQLDCIICSHVLEHVHDPLDMLRSMANALKVGGTLLLSLPNATSILRKHFGSDWRGLEAPRHLSIPSMKQLEAVLTDLGFTTRQWQRGPVATAAESTCIRRRGVAVTSADRAMGRRLASSLVVSSRHEYDFTELACLKGARAV